MFNKDERYFRPETLRLLALEMFDIGEFAAAEQLLQHARDWPWKSVRIGYAAVLSAALPLRMLEHSLTGRIADSKGHQF